MCTHECYGEQAKLGSEEDWQEMVLSFYFVDLRMEPMQSGLAVRAFIHWVISLAPK